MAGVLGLTLINPGVGQMFHPHCHAREDKVRLLTHNLPRRELMIGKVWGESMRWLCGLVGLLFVLGAAAAEAQTAPKRLALIIQNSVYQHVPVLENPARDASLVAQALIEVGFDVVQANDVTKVAFQTALREFRQRSRSAEIVMIYYAGHGVASSGENWLLPVDVQFSSDSEMTAAAISQSEIVASLPPAKMWVVVLDACRYNPFTRDQDAKKPGLAAFESDNVLMMYSAGSGQAASDGGRGQNSPFAASFARLLAQPGVPIQMLPALVREDVLRETNRVQRPYASTSVTTDPIYLKPIDADCAASDGRWIRGLMASADPTALNAFVQATPARCISHSEARRRVEALPAQPSTTRGLGTKAFRDCAACPVMTVVPAGAFVMGSPPTDRDRYSSETPHRVQVASFAAGIFEVSFDEWEACVADGDCGRYMAEDGGWGRGSQPVVSVSWNDAKRYVAWLSRKTGFRYRLLTEAEWEYAARSGTANKRFWWGDVADRRYANYGADLRGEGGAASGADRWINTAPVGSFPPNAFGLHDMIGNVWEWVEDCVHDGYEGAPEDGAAWTTACSAQGRMLRGGSWYDYPGWIRTANRYWDVERTRSDNVGFRVARDQ